ncbi:response regulator [Caballeronia sp. EK]|uniref:response regulator n=1 Tax=Caballeronia sp. EK TaxID=2767469 RepID=UPI0019C9389F|nr:response regulator [Caballeronia sp. EK]MBC8642922.1 response regulator [Caballeronia sp. EK]
MDSGAFIVPAAPTLHLLIVEDHTLIINDIRNLLSNQPCYEIVGVVSDGLVVRESWQRLSPSLVFLDLGLPGMDGSDIIHQFIRRWKTLRIVVVTSSTDERWVRAAITAGALAFVLKSSSRQVSLSAIQHAAIGRNYIDPALKLATAGVRERVVSELALM